MRLMIAVALAALAAPALSEDDMARGMFDPKPYEERGDETRTTRPTREAPPKPRARPNPYEWKEEWRDALNRGEEPGPEFDLWAEEQLRIDRRDPDFRKEVEKRRKELREFRKRYEGWVREAQEALQPGRDI